MIINKKENIFGDKIAYVEQYDFSRANLDDGNRILTITTVASICYQNPKAIGKESLYNRLLSESNGLPSSSFEFVPVLFTEPEITSLYFERKLFVTENNPLTKFGEWVEHNGKKYLLTNYRAVVNLKETHPLIDFTSRYNTIEECEIIKEHFKVFLFKVDLPTRSQMVRHRVNWQELSRRYVSGERVPFEFYISEKMAEVESFFHWTDEETTTYNTNEVLEICLNHYQQALKDGVKPQESRRIIPQAAYTQIWGAFQPNQLSNYFKLRLEEHAQLEIRQTAIAMKELIDEH